MGSFAQLGGVRCVYRLKIWLLGICLTLGAVFLGVGALMAFAARAADSARSAPLIAPIFFLGFGAFMVLWPLRARVVIEGSRISVRDLVKERTADLTEIVGLRTIQTRNASYSRLYLKEGRGSITISKSFNFDDAARAWFQQIADLDQRDRAVLLDEIAKDDELGATAEERLAKLSGAKTWSISLTMVSIAAAAAMLFSHDSFRVAAAFLLAATPVAAFFLMQRSPLLYTIFKPKTDPRGELSFVLIVSAIGLLLLQGGLHFVSFQPLLPLVVTVFLVYLFAFYQVSRKGSSRPGRFFLLLIFAGLYSAGFGAMADTISDRAPAKTYTADVLHKRISRGRSTSYYLTLSPWGPIASPDEVSVSLKVFHSFNVGDQVCLNLHPGSLHAPWYRLVDCPDHLISSPTL
jgi:hypothetical protein